MTNPPWTLAWWATPAVTGLFAAWAFASTIKYLETKDKLADTWTDLSQLIHDGRVDRSDLRRSAEHEPLKRRFEKRER